MKCPSCGARHPAGAGSSPCRRCRTTVSVLEFTPVLAAATLAPGEGRCQAHPKKDAVDACERCGGYVCDVCATRTGEHLYCPTCFDWLHERDELETTVPRRMRWDHLTTVGLFLTMLTGTCVGPLLFPVAFVAACIALWKRRTERYLSIAMPVFVIAIGLLSVALIVTAVVVGLGG